MIGPGADATAGAGRAPGGERPWRPKVLAGMTGSGSGFAVDTASGPAVLRESDVVWTPCRRVITETYAGTNLYDRITDPASADPLAVGAALREAAALTSAVALAAAGRLDLVPPEDRVFGPGTGLIMGAFTWHGPGSRFADGSRGVYYAAETRRTAIRETAYHTAHELAGNPPVVVHKALIEAALRAVLVDVRAPRPTPDGVYDPTDYRPGQAFGRTVRTLEADGIAYDSVRDPGGACAAVFRPPVLSGARVVEVLEYRWDGRALWTP